jgi:hypothetical protein
MLYPRKIEKIPTHQKFVEFCRRVSSNQVSIIRTMNKVRILNLFIVLMMPTWLDETHRQNSTNFWCVGFFSIFRVKLSPSDPFVFHVISSLLKRNIRG